MAYYSMNMRSEYLKGNETVGIIMPDNPRTEKPKDFYQRGKKYRVLWLLHGGMGDYTDWLRKSNIELYASEHNLVVVMPTAMNSQYSNWDNYAVGYDMYHYLLNELMPMIYGWFPVSTKREDNFIAGLSMGGAGVLKFALNNPKLFQGAAVLSWAPYEIPGDPALDEPGNQWLQNEIDAHGTLEALEKSRDNTWMLTKKMADSDLPSFYFSTGENDFLFPRYTRYRDYARQVGFPGEFHSVPGMDHEWRFWDMEIQNVLQFFGIAEKTERKEDQ